MDICEAIRTPPSLLSKFEWDWTTKAWLFVMNYFNSQKWRNEEIRNFLKSARKSTNYEEEEKKYNFFWDRCKNILLDWGCLLVKW